MSGFYCEIDKNGYCYHSTQNELPLSDKILLAEENMIGKTWDGEKWNKPPETEPQPAPTPTQLDRIEAAVTAKNEEIAQTAIDNYTLELMEGGIL